MVAKLRVATAGCRVLRARLQREHIDTGRNEAMVEWMDLWHGAVVPCLVIVEERKLAAAETRRSKVVAFPIRRADASPWGRRVGHVFNLIRLLQLACVVPAYCCCAV